MVHLHCTEAPRNSSIDENHDDFGYARQSAISWRKLLLQRWAGLSHVTQSFHQLWNEHFPHHDALTLQLKQPVRSKAESYWEGESWKKAARAYHEERKLNHRQPPKAAHDRVAGNTAGLP
jgi:hypothetical protein